MGISTRSVSNVFRQTRLQRSCKYLDGWLWKEVYPITSHCLWLYSGLEKMHSWCIFLMFLWTQTWQIRGSLKLTHAPVCLLNSDPLTMLRSTLVCSFTLVKIKMETKREKMSVTSAHALLWFSKGSACTSPVKLEYWCPCQWDLIVLMSRMLPLRVFFCKNDIGVN